MKRRYVFMILAGFVQSSVTAFYDGIESTALYRSLSNEKSFFGKPHADRYWDAFLAVAHGDRALALQIIEALNNNAPHSILPAKDPIDTFFDELFIASVAQKPQLLTPLGLFESIGVTDHNAYLDEVSVQAAYASCALAQTKLAELDAFDRASLRPDQRISYDLFRWVLAHEAAGERFIFHRYIVSQMFGALVSLTALMTMYHRIENLSDAQHYIARLSKIPHAIAQIIDYLEQQRERGIMLPACALSKMIEGIKKSLPLPVTEHLFYQYLARACAKLEGVDVEEIKNDAQQILTDHIYPAYQKMVAYGDHLAQLGATDHGVGTFADGDAFYQYMLSYHTTTAMTPDEIHALGLREVATIQDTIRALLKAQGIDGTGKSVGALIQELSSDSRFYFENTDAGRAACCTAFEQIIERSRKELYPFFHTKPTQPVVVQAVPAQEQDGQPAAYYMRPSMDGSRPGTFFINMRDMREIPRYRMETLAVHEAEPGHHFQLSLQQQMDMPLLRRLGSFTAYVEGWALYVEKLAYEQGFYSNVWAQLGHLIDELLRAARLVVDTGLHAKGWTRQQAIEYMIACTGSHYNTVATEVDRYLVYPGQACSYKIGQLKILELRERMKQKLGAAFDIKTFHAIILATGAVPLTILETVVDDYCERQSHAENSWAQNVLASLTLREKIGQLFVVATTSSFEQREEALAASLFRCPYTMDSDYIKRLITEYHVGGIIFLYKSTPELQIAATNEYQALSKIPLLIAQDCEWGLSMRLYNTLEFPKNNLLGMITNKQLIYQMGREIGRECKALGVHLNCSPVVDVCNNPHNILLQKRSFGADPTLVAQCGLLMMQGLQDEGIIACAKHFPGHGDTDIDSHAHLPCISHDYAHIDQIELAPFKHLIDHGVRAVMLAHLSVPALEPDIQRPSSLSYAITTKLLEHDLHFTGLKITDGLGMGALTQHYEPGIIEREAFLAGADILLCPLDVPRAVAFIEQAIRDNCVSVAELDRRVLKILQAKEWAGCHRFKPLESAYALAQLNTVEGRALKERLDHEAKKIRT